ncbi:glycerophosphodiester phosphodiesterase family protein [Gammaproteobacteria bacterium]|nr:glycerophosphodiester phosphodiesterase family protein [Gammaproteobacteria bacterium]|tara:strand:+ start:1252 stop:1980 length:729 start_codon:yes stop_codon:yes gene_type:complete
MKSYLDYKGFEVLAHRGGSIESYENTVESFQYSIELGCKYIETDVQLSSDGKPYIFHDDSIKRLTGQDLLFNELHSADIDKIRIFNNLKIPLLKDVLLKFPNTKFQIDVKTDEVAMPSLEIIHQINAENRVCIASFSSARLERVSAKYPEICISMGPKEIVKLLLSSFGLYGKKIPGDCLQVPIYQYGIKLVTKRFVSFIHSKGLKIIVWTINDEKTMKMLFDMGVDGVITDKPKKLFEVIN